MVTPEPELLTHWIDGRARTSDGRTRPVHDPATGEVIALVPLADDDVTDEAVAAARDAADGWGAMSLGRRTEVLFAFRQLLVETRDELARCVSREHGKTIEDALGEVARGIENVEYACGVAELLKGATSSQVASGVDVVTLRQPLGVVVGITPFNFPVMVPLWMAANALACGNAFVLKPSERDPSPSLMLARLLEQAGLPPGVFSVVNGDAAAVDRLVAHPDVVAVSFVGSTAVARHVHARATAAGTRVQALGGAKNHLVVLPDADIDAAADAAVSAAFGSAGERCMAVSVVVPVGDVADPLVDAIAVRLGKIRVGPGDAPDTDMGPLISAEHRERVRSFLEPEALGDATLVVDGREAQVPAGGYFIGCSLVDHVEPGSPVYDDEIFGPVLAVVRRDSYDDALEVVNGHRYGNGAAIFTRDGGRARHFQLAVQAGMVGVNVPIPVPVGSHSFGGWGDSLFGDVHMYGPEGIRFYTRAKVVTSRWPDAPSAGVDLGFPGSQAV